VARVSAKGCSVRRGVGGAEGGEGEGEKAVAVASMRRDSGTRLRQGGVLPY
jgi:hypothetical protein